MEGAELNSSTGVGQLCVVIDEELHASFAAMHEGKVENSGFAEVKQAPVDVLCIT